MVKFKLDLERAKLELVHISNLVCAYEEFYENECPEAENCTDDEKIVAFIFAARSHQFFSLIDAAQDKINAMCEEITTAVENTYKESKKGGEVA